MTPDPDTIVCHARELPADERAAYLDQACAGDASLRGRLDAKLAELKDADAFFADKETMIESSRRAQEDEGSMIGPYKLLQQIGEGGFGTVWMAEQQHPVRRRVALKIIKAGMDTKEVVARFEQERQALAMMDHPNIAKVFDAGATETGRLYFVMELVKGIPITRFCDEKKLGIRERLALFADVCSAINHAHQKGIIHRDIKPSNVMVTLHGEKAVPKVIDFGIAKATQNKLTDKTLFTRFEQFIGTPVYMSPEQAALSGLDIDTRSDIYALGILLYELLTGRPPFDAQTLVSAGYDEMRRIIREEQPLSPSRMLREVTTRKGREGQNKPEGQPPAESPSRPSGPLRPAIPADLDLIVMKAIEKDRARRYETANAFALDIQHFLADEPVSASPPGAGYLLRKFARRHRAALRVAAAITLLLVAATVVSTVFAIRATRALEQVRIERDQKDDIVRFVTVMLRSPNPAYNDRNITVAKVLDQAVPSIGVELAGQPLRQAGVRSIIGGSYAGLGDSAKAIPLLEAAYDFYLRSPEFGPEHEDTIQSLAALASSYDYATRRKEAIVMQRRVLAWSEAHRPAGHPDISKAMAALGRTLHFDGSMAEGLALQKKAYKMSCQDPGPTDLKTLPLMHWLAVACGRSKAAEDHAEARRLDLELYEICKVKLGATHPETIRARSGAAGQIPDTAARFREQAEVEQQSAEVNGPEHPYTLSMIAFRAASLRAGGQRREARQLLEDLLPRMKKAMGLRHADTLWVMSELANAREYNSGHRKVGSLAVEPQDESDRKDALRLWEDAARLSEEFLGPEHYDTLGRKAKLAGALDKDQQNDAAMRLREEILPLYQRIEAYGPRHNGTEWVRRELLGNYATALKQPDLAAAEATRLRDRLLALLKDSADYWRATAPADNADRRAAEKQYALALVAADRFKDAAPYFTALGITPPRAPRKERFVILPPDSEWRWRHPTDGMDPGFQSRFAQPDFPDSTWGTARDSEAPDGGFGYTKEKDLVIGRPLEGQRYTAYFRCKFKVSQASAAVELRCRCDDGLIVYLDGKEVARYNMSTATDTWRLCAATVVDEADAVLPLPALTPGEHVLAISLHNSSPESSDLRLGGITLVEVEEK